MTIDDSLLTGEERCLFALRALWRSRGFRQYRMSKFEEYDLYARNKDFLISGSILSFTDVNGRLMALKPDVTLSIVRSGRDAAPETRKLYYHENVYRPAAHGGPFRELTQAGVELQGALGPEDIAETLALAAESLALASPDWRLAVSHLGVVTGLLDRLGAEGERREALLNCVARKNAGELAALCAFAPAEAAEGLLSLLRCSGKPAETLPLLRSLGCGDAAAELETVTAGLQGIRIDFSIVSNLNYYNGVVFEGYVSGAPGRVLSGGQYDRLMRKLGRSDRAIGFALYMDQLERLLEEGGAEA
ncbi:MAG: ATP phosphoribosyltransferase regulatory subunit [Oscillospiraceae bacterium]|nr:ATP phosphoribosyltransferase regulatory subunit [Oscillospiraceae bacterium]